MLGCFGLFVLFSVFSAFFFEVMALVFLRLGLVVLFLFLRVFFLGSVCFCSGFVVEMGILYDVNCFQ